MTLYLTEADVEKLIDMETALEAVEAAHVALSTGQVSDISRQRIRTGKSMQHILQAGWPAQKVMGYKAYVTSAAGARFWLHLFDSDDAHPLAVIEADFLGMMRTGAAAGIAAHYMARDNARLAGVIGAGWQAQGQILALAQVRPIELFKVYARDPEKLKAFCAQMSAQTGRKVIAVEKPQDAVTDVDIVVTATTSSRPVLEGAWLSSGVHINAMGSNSLARRELDETAVNSANIICVDSVQTALGESGDLLLALEKGRLFARQLIELGDVVTGLRSGRESAEQITLFESQGLAIQDIALGIEVFKRAQAAGSGLKLPY